MSLTPEQVAREREAFCRWYNDDCTPTGLHGGSYDDCETTWLARAERAAAEREQLITALRECLDSMIHWADYADDYFREKHNLKGDIAKYESILAPREKGATK